MSHHQPDSEEVECRECGAVFRLDLQYYYDNLCPSCKREQDGEEATNPTIGSCHVCGDDVPANKEYYSQKAAHPEMRRGDGVLVCPDHRDHRFTPDVETGEQIRAIEEMKEDDDA